MFRKTCLLSLLALSPCLLMGRQFSPYNNLSKGSVSCPRRDSVGSAPHDGNYAVVFQPDEQIIPVEKRKSVSGFGVTDPNGKLKLVSDCEGKVVIIAFWSPSCSISTSALIEAGFIQAQVRQKGMTVEVWPVHMEAWPGILSFLRSAKDKTSDVTAYRAAIGDQGVHALSPVDLPALPAMFIIDRHGRLADCWVGYYPNRTIMRLNKLYQEN